MLIYSELMCATDAQLWHAGPFEGALELFWTMHELLSDPKRLPSCTLRVALGTDVTPGASCLVFKQIGAALTILG